MTFRHHSTKRLVQAQQFDGTQASVDAIIAMTGGAVCWDGARLTVETPHGLAAVAPGNWVTRNEDGEACTYKPTLFAKYFTGEE